MSNRVKRSRPSRAAQRHQQATAVQGAQRWGTVAAIAAGIVILVIIGLFVFAGDDAEDEAVEGISFHGVALPGPDGR